MGDFFSQVARHILSSHTPPDLREVVVLLPNYHAAQPLAEALAGASAFSALLLPQMITLADWADSVSPDEPVQSDTQRIATLYHALRERNWFPDADLWSLSRELLALMDELTCHCVSLPVSCEEFAQQLTLAYQARSGVSMQFEARVVHELWYAMASGGEMDAAGAYQLRLARLAGKVDAPLYVLQTGDLSAPEARFLQSCRERVAVTLFDVREMAGKLPSFALLTSALQPQEADLLSTAEGLKNQTAAILSERLKLFGAHGMEEEAEAADVQIRRWLIEGRQSIAVVVQDRLVARRLRALLERAKVQVQDETGWTFATLSVSTVLMRWLEAVQGDFYYQDVLDLLKSPLLFFDNPAQRKLAAWQFEQMVRAQGVVAHLPDYIAVAERNASELVPPLVRLRQASSLLGARHLTLAGWLNALHESLEILGVVQGWQQDAAGQQLLQLLSLWQEELQTDATSCSFAEWRRWLTQQLDLNTFRDLSVESPVIFTHLAATRWRSFDALLLPGCDAAHLPSPASAGVWFNDAVRATLGLPLSVAAQAQVRDDLLSLLAMNGTVLATWQASSNGEPNLLSPYFEMLRAMHLLAFGHDLMDEELGGMLAWAKVRMEDSGFRIQDSGCRMQEPRPVVPELLIPQRISPSGYNALVACPYQYFARHVLHLNELDEVREDLDKRDYGTWVHAVLQRFHDEIPQLEDLGRAEQAMGRISSEVFAQGLAHDYLAQAWLLRWQAQIPAYLEWQLKNEADGWRYRSAEVPFEINVSERLQLRGRIDRVDIDDAGGLSVLDYKTQSAFVLKNKLKDPGEDVQLACYAQAVSAQSAAFVSLEDETVQAILPPEEISELASLTVGRLKTVFEEMQNGAGLPAHGAEKICGYCEMRGLCRRGEWEEKQDSGFMPQGHSHETAELKLRFLSEGFGMQDSYRKGPPRTTKGKSPKLLCEDNPKPQTENPKPQTENGSDHG